MIASIIFVYAFIGITIWVSLSKWGTLRMDLNLREPFGFTSLVCRCLLEVPKLRSEDIVQVSQLRDVTVHGRKRRLESLTKHPLANMQCEPILVP